MTLIEFRINPTAKDLKWFGLILLAFFALVGVLVWRATGALGMAADNVERRGAAVGGVLCRQAAVGDRSTSAGRI